jgi:hypothetical protein
VLLSIGIFSLICNDWRRLAAAKLYSSRKLASCKLAFRIYPSFAAHLKGGCMRSILLAILPLFTTAAWANTFTGPEGKYYLINLYDTTIYVVQGPRVVESFRTARGYDHDEQVLAVSETIRTRARSVFSGAYQEAGEYTLSGDPTGFRYTTPHNMPGGGLVYDGTSDGTYNYYVEHNTASWLGGVFRTDYYWQDPQRLFYPEDSCNSYICSGLSGIAYDPTNGSLWISSTERPWIWDYSLEGVLLAKFYTGDIGCVALGFDPADSTLWVSQNKSNVLRQYSLDGELLQVGTPSGLPEGWYESGEFKEVVPEPSTFVLMLPVIGVIGFRIRSICTVIRK